MMKKSLNFSYSKEPNVALSEAGKLMGSVRSKKKAEAARLNGKKGGRPKKEAQCA
jgi:hypothetical protein